MISRFEFQSNLSLQADAGVAGNSLRMAATEMEERLEDMGARERSIETREAQVIS